MKKYFCKFLPVEGEIKEGDFYITSPDYKIVRKCEDRSWGTFEMCKKVKLFLCSRDIEVGDKAWTTVGSCFDTFKEGYDKQYWFKVIGEISSEATWVKEGDEFDEYEEWWWNSSLGSGSMIMKKMKEEFDNIFKNYPDITIVCKVKGPCGHFH